MVFLGFPSRLILLVRLLPCNSMGPPVPGGTRSGTPFRPDGQQPPMAKRLAAKAATLMASYRGLVFNRNRARFARLEKGETATIFTVVTKVSIFGNYLAHRGGFPAGLF